MIKFFVVGILFLYSAYLPAQQICISDDEKYLVNSEISKYGKLFEHKSHASAASEWFDVSYYRLNLAITTNPQYLQGVVTIKGECREKSSAILIFDLMNSMQVDSVKVDSVLYPFLQEPASLEINLGFIFPSGRRLTADIYYRGLPQSTGFGSFIFGDHNGTP